MKARSELPQDQKAVGRPTKFNDWLCAKIIHLAKEGKTDAQIAKLIGISLRTFHVWKREKPEFLHTLKEAKNVADELVEASLFRRAVGYSHRAVKIMQHEGVPIREEYIEHYPPDTTAAIFWLKNRKPEEWRDQQEHKHSGKITLEDLVGGSDSNKGDDE